MLPIRTILHPTDFSESAVQAFWLAYALARDYGARVDVLHVVTKPDVGLGEAFAPSEPDQIPEARSEQLSQMRSIEPRVQVNHQLVCGGNVADEIVRAAERTKASVIVMGTYGRRGLCRLSLGSVAEAVVRRSPCPVITVNGPLKFVTPPGGAKARDSESSTVEHPTFRPAGKKASAQSQGISAADPRKREGEMRWTFLPSRN